MSRMDSPQIPHRNAELLRYLRLRRAGPMEAIPVGVPARTALSVSGKSSASFDFCHGRRRRKSSFHGLEGKV
jgi:hypothetical protein